MNVLTDGEKDIMSLSLSHTQPKNIRYHQNKKYEKRHDMNQVNQLTDYDCDCVISSTHGIPCHYMLQFLEGEDDDLMPYHIHGFWRSLEYYKPLEVDKWEDQDVADRNVLQGMVQQICGRGGLKEPKESDAPKGRPRKKATARDPSWFKHEGVRTTPSKSWSTPRKSRTTPNKERPTPTSKSRPTPSVDDYYMQFIPEKLHYLVRYVIDVDGDGHCGFRCVSYAIYPSDQHRYLEMRHDLIDHITIYWGILYHNVYAPTELEEVKTRLGWLSPTQCPKPYWLHNWDLSEYANLQNRAFVVFDKWGPNGIPYGEICLPMAHAYRTSPVGVTYLVCMG
ncbi:hypothetical protein LINGRAHAP2_LOCUS2224 [Linum grandiflorum]